ncbi:MAG: hypothetical protein JSS65_14360 [Armatimonadetes bacterium]|nr:hypothetical protein [Armatimonadota bacterium]
MARLLRTSLITLILAVAALALGQSFSSDGSGTLTIAGRRHQIERVRTEPSGKRIRIMVWTTNDKRFDLVGDNAKQGDSYRVRVDDGLGEKNLTGYVNIYSSDWRTLKSIEGSGRFSGGNFSLSFQANRSNTGGGNSTVGSRVGSLNIDGRNFNINRGEYRTDDDGAVRIVLHADNGKEYHLVGSRNRRGNTETLSFYDGLGESNVSGSATVAFSGNNAVSASGRGRFSGGSFSFNSKLSGYSAPGWGNDNNRPNRPGNQVNGKLRFDNTSFAINRYEYKRDGNNFRLIIWTDRGERYDIVGSRNEASGDRDKLYINDGLGKKDMDGTGTAYMRGNSLSSLSMSGRYRGGDFSVTINGR